MSGNQSMYLNFYFFIIVFFSITQKLFLLYFSSAQISHLYDVSDSVYCFIIEKLQWHV